VRYKPDSNLSIKEPIKYVLYSIKVLKSCQKVFKKFSKSFQSCQETVKKESYQKIVKNYVKENIGNRIT
jgi:hypothetical protein